MGQQNNSAFRPLLEIISEILEIGVDKLKDPVQRTALLTALGFDASKVPDLSKLPNADSLKAAIQKLAEDFSPGPIITAVGEVTQVVTGFVAFFASANGPNADAVLKLFLNEILLEYVERKAPGFKDLVNTLKDLASNAPASRDAADPNALSYNFLEEIIGKFFDKLSQGKPEEATAIVTDLPFILLTALLKKVDKAIGSQSGSVLQIKPNFADLPGGGGKFLQVNLGKPDDNNKHLTLSFEKNDTRQLVVKLKGKAGLNFDEPHTFDGNKRLTLKAKLNAAGELEIGKDPNTNLDVFARANFLHRRDDEPLWSILDTPLFQFVPATYQLDVQAKNDDIQFKVRFDLKYAFGRGSLSGFPFDFLPENQSGKQSLELGWSIKRSFFGSGSSVGADAAIAELESFAARDGAAPTGPIADILKQLLNMISLNIPLHLNIGGILGLETLYIASSVSDDLKIIGIEASLDFWIKFGPPITLNVSRMGILLNLEKTPDGTGLLGYKLEPKVKFPNGMGVVVNASVITGGGFLYIDEPKGEYYGALQLSFKGLFDMKAVGIINTKRPDGTKEFSMFILVTAEFSAIQLGFGFTLLGVGGMLGINRGMEVEPIRVGIRTGAIRSILFPEDVVGNIQRIISDIKQIFPQKTDSFVIGLMAKIGWGTPTLISVELGVMVALPDPKIVIVGIIKCILPAEEAPLLKLQVNFIGVIDFQNEFIYFEARLFDSSVVGIPLTGSLAFAVAWGKNSTFGISVGGFHPDFKDYPTVPTLPGAFRDMDRIGIQLLSGDNPRLGVEAYFAVTSNSVQFGARAELYAEGPLGFNLYGCLAFDALFIFNPFRFTIGLQATLAIRHNTTILFGINFKGRLSGPRPWNVAGEVSFSVFPFVTVTIGFDVTWGDPALPPSSASKDLWAELRQEIRKNNNWKVEIPDYHNLHVTVREFSEEEKTLLLVHPFGRLIFSQRALPLDYDIQKFGEFKPLNVSRFSVSNIRAGKDPDTSKNIVLKTADVKETFAAGNYTNLSESEKLSRKSFEPFNSGKNLTDEGKVKSPLTGLEDTVVNYELDYLSNNEKVVKLDKKASMKMQVGAFKHLNRNAAVSKSALSWSKQPGLSLNSPQPVQLQEQLYFVVREDNMQVILKDSKPLSAATQSEAQQMLKAWEALNPDDKGELQVVEMHEIV